MPRHAGVGTHKVAAMRSNWNSDLEHMVRRTPQTAREIVEAVVVTNEHTRQRIDQWLEADSTAAFATTNRGSLQLVSSANSPMEQTSFDDDFLLFGQENTTRTVGKLTYTPAAYGRQFSRITANLDPNEDGTSGANVVRWYCQLYQLMKPQVSQREGAELQPMHFNPVSTSAGPGAGAVDFPFTHQGNNPTISALGKPVVYVMIWGVQSDGSPATNVSWRCSTSQPNPFNDGGADLTAVGIQLRPFGYFEGGLAGSEPDAVPTLTVRELAYTEATVTFSSDPFDLGAAPSNDVELHANLDTPAGTSAVTEWRTSTGPDVWTAFVDGDLVGVDNTPRGGTDLSAFSATQTYALRVTLTPNANADRTPALVSLGVREIEITDLDGLVRIESEDWHCDPVTMHSTAPRTTFAIQHDGVRDWEDLGSRLLSENHISSIEFRIWWGHQDLPRNKWMLWDTYWVTGPVTGLPSELRVTCATQLARLAHVLPVGDTTGSATREAFVVTNQSVEDAITDIYAEISFPDRYEGPHPDDSSVVSKRIENSRAKAETDQLAFIAGGTQISSQGRVKFVSIFESTEGTAAVFQRGEVMTVSTSPGWEQRLPVLFLKWDWVDSARGFRQENRYVHENSLTALGRTFGQSDEWIEEGVGRWIVSETVADAVGERHNEAFAVGVITWTIETIYSYPELEIGDVVAAETDTFVARDPNSTREVVGRRWGVGVIVGHNRRGTRFKLWIPSYANILAVSTAVTTEGRAIVTRHLPYTAFAGTESTGVDLEVENGYLVLASNPFPQECRASVDRPEGATAILNIRMRTLAGDGSTVGQVECALHESIDGSGNDILSTINGTDSGVWATTEANSIATPPVTLNDDSSLSVRCFLTPTDDPLQARLLWCKVDFEVVIR